VAFQRYTSEVQASINGILAPLVGGLMARTAASAHCRELGIQGIVMSEEQVEALLAKLGLGLIIFLGKDKTTGVIAAMRQAIQELREAA
jgi:hypothetical protein